MKFKKDVGANEDMENRVVGAGLAPPENLNYTPKGRLFRNKNVY